MFNALVVRMLLSFDTLTLWACIINLLAILLGIPEILKFINNIQKQQSK